MADLKENKKLEIAAAARNLFTDFGYKPVSMDQIAAKANVAKGTIYLYFKDKEDLFGYLVEELLQELKELMKSYEEKKWAVLDEIHEVVYNLLMYRKNQKFLFKAVQEAKELKTPVSIKAVERLDSLITRYLERRLKDAVDDGVIKPCDPSTLAFVIIRVYSALAFEWEENHTPLNEKQIAEHVRLFIQDGLLNKD